MDPSTIKRFIVRMIRNSIAFFLGSLLFFLCVGVPAAQEQKLSELPVTTEEPRIGSWAFSGMVTNESGDRYGYFFQMQRQGLDFHVKTALIDGQTNQLMFFYENREHLTNPSPLNWHVGHSFMRFNPINDSWVFGVKGDDKKGFNFKVDMLKEGNNDDDALVLRPGVEMQALVTSRLNGHIITGADAKELFVTGNNAWFGKVWFSKDQNATHDISTTFCRLANDNGFYSANLKEEDATAAAVAGWRDATGKKVKMSQFISIKSLADNQCLLKVGLPKLSLKLMNTLKQEENMPLAVAGFSQDAAKGFCFVAEQSFLQVKEASPDALVSVAVAAEVQAKKHAGRARA